MILGADGAVINQGIINASLGGNVALIGKQVINEGVINARLGTVNLAAGKEAVLTFDQQGLLGVRISKEVLQDELGIDPAVLNEGNINAEGGRVLLTASVSRDVFSQAVNHDGIEQATSVVVNGDGSFTLGGGADVVNTGIISSSAQSAETKAGQIIVIGENVTSSGVIESNSTDSDAGQVELHSQQTTRLTGDSLTTAIAEQSGQGGEIKLLGNQVGLFDNSVVDASGAEGGGEVLTGGDRQGLNEKIRNAEFIYTGINTQIKADALIDGDGGKLIAFATDTARLYGNLYSRGGADSGNGGFIETSGLWGFEILNTPDISAVSGIVSNYRMGEDASFNGTNWTVPDQVGTNTGTSANMTLDDLVGEAPNYTGGGISSGMTIEDRVGEAPNSDNNALSYNMDEVDRVEETP